ncbi:hypothetical protein Bpfe_014468 [Biomphalaria pfeifferi]|uniref:Uncharacterized protein n=1 Tax=Biomphalaria pfeifferi TaxID=112525 RepID=A0AAD8BK21_BIOPF|nr:hypothetical protein Bpfe_014468 [Biomphalaria pfeifferi]
MGSQYSVTGPYGHTFSFSDFMGSQYFVTRQYGHTLFFPDIMNSQDSVTSRTVYDNTISFSEIIGSQYSVTFFFPDIMGSQDSVTSRMFTSTQSPFPRSWVVNTPSPVIWRHIFLS